MTPKKQHNHKKNPKKFTPTFQGPKNAIWLCGKHPCFAILKNKRRKIYEILVTKNSINDLETYIKDNDLAAFIPLIKRVEAPKITDIIGQSQPHQGIAINCSALPTKDQYDLLEELEAIEDKNNLPKLLLLDQVSDPHNIGAIIRSAISFGVTKIIFCEHNAPKENATIVKAAAGTMEACDLVVVTNFNKLIDKLKKIGYWCIGLAGEGNHSLKEAKTYENIALIVGSEGGGIRNLVKKNCDLLVKIDIDNQVESLNASVATAIALYELSQIKG